MDLVLTSTPLAAPAVCLPLGTSPSTAVHIALPTPLQNPPARRKLFLGLCSGSHPPLDLCIRSKGHWVLLPLDASPEWGGASHDLLDNTVFSALQSLCSSGQVALAHASPPCSLFSRLRDRPPGPPALVSDSWPDGRPDLSDYWHLQLSEAIKIHSRCADLLLLVLNAGGVATWETPRRCRTLDLSILQPLLQALPFSGWAHMCRVSDWLIGKAWLFRSSSNLLEQLRLDCLGGHAHGQIQGLQNPDGSWVSASTAAYPGPLCEAYHNTFQELLPTGGPLHFLPWSDSFSLPSPCTSTDTFAVLRVQDGGGLQSSACFQQGPDKLAHIRKALWPYILHSAPRDQLTALSAGIHNKDSAHPVFEAATVTQMVADVVSVLGLPASASLIPAGQPLRLHLLQALATSIGDHDAALCDILAVGVPTGVLRPIQPSGIWRTHESEPSIEAEQLLWHDGNWSSAEDKPDIALQLMLHEVEQGWVEEIHGGMPEAVQRWGPLVAVGKLGVVDSPGKAPRLIGDSSCSNANSQSCIMDKAECPTILNLAASLGQLGLDTSQVSFLSLDVSAAHKQVLVRPEERGLSLFRVQHRLFCYKTCHFGAKWSAYWWGRLGALVLRVTKQIIFFAHCGLLYVDDFIWCFPTNMCTPLSLLVCAVLSILGLPMSWHKLAVGSSVTWVGFALRLSSGLFASLPGPKLAALREGLKKLGSPAKKVSRRLVSAVIGLLVWATQLFPLLRSWLYHLYRSLYRPKMGLHNLSVYQLAELACCCSANFKVLRDLTRSDLRAGLKIMAIGNSPVTHLDHLLCPRLRSGRAWVKTADTNSLDTMIDDNAAEAAMRFQHFFLSNSSALVGREWQLPLTSTTCFAFADAWADDSCGGMGGWFASSQPSSPTEIKWFHIPLHLSQFPSKWGLTSLQKAIATLELLAQCALLMLHPVTSSTICIVQHSDNLPSVGATAKGMSTKAPLCFGMTCLATIAVSRQIQVQISHVAGIRNEWADHISRLNCASHAHFMQVLDPSLRVRISLDSLLELSS